jgi:hypothetical protein
MSDLPKRDVLSNPACSKLQEPEPGLLEFCKIMHQESTGQFKQQGPHESHLVNQIYSQQQEAKEKYSGRTSSETPPITNLASRAHPCLLYVIIMQRSRDQYTLHGVRILWDVMTPARRIASITSIHSIDELASDRDTKVPRFWSTTCPSLPVHARFNGLPNCCWRKSVRSSAFTLFVQACS